MFSYRHAFHAGNHADVLKHICQRLILEKLKAKDKPYIVIDTHSGAGCYDLDSEQALKTAEFSTGIDKLIEAQPDNADINSYLQWVQGYRQNQQYPGSPKLSADLSREQDKLCLMEWHNQEIHNLKRNMGRDSRIAIHHRDGYEGLLAMVPPKPARGLVLIDPSYEVPEDYQNVVSVVDKAYSKWTTGIFAIWYPILAKKRDKSQKMLGQLAQKNFKSLLTVELDVKGQAEELGMHGSGMAIINAPWQFAEQAEAVLTQLVPALAEDTQADGRLQWLIAAE